MKPLAVSVTRQAHHCHAFTSKNQVHYPPDSTPISISRCQMSWHIETHCFCHDLVLAVVHKLMKMKSEGHERRTWRNPSIRGVKDAHICPCDWLRLSFSWLCTLLSCTASFIHPSIHLLYPFISTQGDMEASNYCNILWWKTKPHKCPPVVLTS